LAWEAASPTIPPFPKRSTAVFGTAPPFAYADNYLIDLKAAIILDVEPTRAIRQAEVGTVKTMIDRTEACLFGLKPQRLCGDYRLRRCRDPRLDGRGKLNNYRLTPVSVMLPLVVQK
jgi:hypothetical protein